MKLREKEKQGGDEEGDEIVELTVQGFGRSACHYKMRRGESLKDFIKKNGIKTKGFVLLLNGKQLEINEETGELEEDCNIDEDSVLAIHLKGLTGGQ